MQDGRATTGEGGAVATILGAGTLLPDDDRRSPAHLLEGEGFSLLLDCGSGAVHGMARHGVRWQDVTHVAVSHFHADHTGDLPALLWALCHGLPDGREEPLVLLGPRGLARRIDGLVQAYGEFVLAPGFPVEVVELERSGRWTDGAAGLELRSHEARHTPESIAYRVGAGGISMGYTGDTGPHPALGSFFEGTDLLISECGASDRGGTDNHLSPHSVAAMLRDARPAVAVLTHLHPGLDPARLPDLIREQGFTGEVLAGRDGLRVVLPLGRRSAHAPELPGDHST